VKLEGKRQLEIPVQWWEDNIKVFSKEMKWDRKDRIHSVRYRIQ
jgi:hypothetical protein